jgi:hypothetical protein
MCLRSGAIFLAVLGNSSTSWLPADSDQRDGQGNEQLLVAWVKGTFRKTAFIWVRHGLPRQEG